MEMVKSLPKSISTNGYAVNLSTIGSIQRAYLAQPATKISLFDGAQVRLNIIGHHKPVFFADASHGGFVICGSLYYKDGTPLDPRDPAVVEIVTYQ